MKLLRLQLALCAVSCIVVAVSNKLLEDYERKLNSINDQLTWRRNPSKHRMKRYRCVEEYVDEHGNVIEEGKEHFTTPAPVRSPQIQRKRTKNTRLHGLKNTGVAAPRDNAITKGLKVTMIKKKRKMKPSQITTSQIQVTPSLLGDFDVETTLTRVYPIATSTTTRQPTTEVNEEDGNVDETIMKKFFQPVHEDSHLQRTRRIEELERMTESTTTVEPQPLNSHNLRLPSVDSAEVPDHFIDHDNSVEEGRRYFRRRQRKLGGLTKYTRDRLDYDTNYDDYNYNNVEEELPFIKRIGRRKLRQYLGFPIMRYPGRRELRYTRVEPLPPQYFVRSRSPTVVRPAVTHTATESAVRQQLRSIAVPFAYGVLQAAPPTPLPSTPPQPTPAPLAAPPLQLQPAPVSVPVPPILQPIPMEESTPETCRRMRRLAGTFGITDISSYARRNCRFLQTFAPGYTCEQITHFVDSCDKKKLDYFFILCAALSFWTSFDEFS